MGGNPANAQRTVWPRVAGWPEIIPKRLHQGNNNNSNQQQQQWNPNQQGQFGGNSIQMPMNQQFGMPTSQPTQQMPMQQPFPMQQMGQQQFGASMMGYPGMMGGQRFF